MTLEEVNSRIATLEQKIAEKKAMDARYNRPASTFDYIIAGDRSGLDRIAQQQMTEELAKKQQINTALDKMDELMKLRNKAAINVNYAEQALKYANDKGDKAAIDAAERDLKLAKEDLVYYNNRTGYNETPKETPKQPTPTPTPTLTRAPILTPTNEEPKMNLASYMEQLKAITDGKNSKQYSAILDEIKSNPNYGQSKELQAQYERINKLYKNRLVVEAELAYIKNWKPGDPIKQGFEYATFDDKGQPLTIRKIKK